MSQSYDESRPVHWTSYDRVATASADLRMVFTILKMTLGPTNYTSVLEYLDCIDKNLEKMGKLTISWATSNRDKETLDRLRHMATNPNTTTNDVWNLLETGVAVVVLDDEDDAHAAADVGFVEPKPDDIASAAVLRDRADDIYEWLRARLVRVQPRGAALPDEIANGMRWQSLMTAVVEKMRKETDR